MAYSKHTIELTDVQCLVVSNALNMLINNEDKHPDDKRLAQEVRNIISQVVLIDKCGYDTAMEIIGEKND